ncbi:ent-kaurene synthase, chloroplastic isoform X2 [Aristolochia californica]|uniref:ent-kaurene synthase, chloroplastic isoform X2 n=1 Tax=Aristolochia californica TaxID=171875 RepID=UPI0035D5E1B4
MILTHSSHFVLLPMHQTPWNAKLSGESMDVGERARNCTMSTEKRKDQIKKLFTKTELSVSSYDTAWVAMVPSPQSCLLPCFPQCLNWLMENQLPDGSWGLHCHPRLIKDAVSSTLACVLALRKWNAGEVHMEKGLHFIESNIGSVMDEKKHSPSGFDIIFPGMVEYAKDLGLVLPLSPAAEDAMFLKRDSELKRSKSEGREAYLAYVSEGLGKLQDWGEIMKYQRKNGSLFNSPSTTAAALNHLSDAKGLAYLHSVLDRFGNAVPTAHPMQLYTQLCMVDSLEKMGIARHFRNEIRSVLDRAYRCWLEGDEEIHLDSATCAIAFRLLRLNGYKLSSDSLAQFAEEKLFFNSLGGHLCDTSTILELYQASQIIIFPNELALEKLNAWSNKFLKNQLSKDEQHVENLHKKTAQEVDNVLKFPYYANLQRLESRRYIEKCSLDDFRVLKTVYWLQSSCKRDMLDLAIEDFNSCQSIHHQELKQLERWFRETRLDQLQFARQKLTYCFFSAAATLFPPEVSDARMAWAQNGILTTVVDDFFDVGGCREEMINLIELVEKWDGNLARNFCSEQVEIIFFALYNSINEIGAKAFAYQRRSVTHHLWLCLLKSMMTEADWVRNKSFPTLEEYINNGYVSFALGPIILPSLYFVGPMLSEEIVRDPEYHTLFKLTSICGRLLNDINGLKKESLEGKLNSVTLLIGQGATEEEVLRELRSMIDRGRRELLRLVVQREGSVVPRACKDLFWNMNKILHLFYMRNDGFSSPTEMVSAVKAVIHEPISLPFKAEICEE